MTLNEYETEMRRVMRYVLDGKPLKDLTNDENRLLKECYDAGYIEGLVPVEMINGRVVIEIRHEALLTRKGVAFLEESETHEKEPAQEVPQETPERTGEKTNEKTDEKRRWKDVLIKAAIDIIVAVIVTLIGVIIAKFLG